MRIVRRCPGLRHEVGAPAIGADPAFGHQGFERIEHLRRQGRVHLVEMQQRQVDAVALEPAAAAADDAADAFGRHIHIAIAAIGMVHLETELGDDDRVSVPGDLLAHQHFRMPRAIAGRRIKDACAHLIAGLQRRPRLRIVGGAIGGGGAIVERRPADGPAAQANAGHGLAVPQGHCALGDWRIHRFDPVLGMVLSSAMNAANASL